MHQVVSHLAFADESSHNTGRFRSISAVTLAAANLEECESALRAALDDAGVRELKWSRVKSARERFAGLAFLDLVLGWARDGVLRVDSLVWDIQDRRHSVPRRHDLSNLGRMHYHLLRAVFYRRWPGGVVWRYHPDAMEGMNWETLRECLDYDGLSRALPEAGLATLPNRGYRVAAVDPLDSAATPLVQAADLFAGLAAYSHDEFAAFRAWQEEESGQQSLFENVGKPLSKADRARGPLLVKVEQFARGQRWQLSLDSSRGLRSNNPSAPVNFWVWESQHDEDFAPTRPVRPAH